MYSEKITCHLLIGYILIISYKRYVLYCLSHIIYYKSSWDCSTIVQHMFPHNIDRLVLMSAAFALKTNVDVLPRSFTLYPSDGARPDSGIGACSTIGVLLETQPAKPGLPHWFIDSVESSSKDHLPTAFRLPEACPVKEHCCILLCFKGCRDWRTGGHAEQKQISITQGRV